jgi:hypothetical protein
MRLIRSLVRMGASVQLHLHLRLPGQNITRVAIPKGKAQDNAARPLLLVFTHLRTPTPNSGCKRRGPAREPT